MPTLVRKMTADLENLIEELIKDRPNEIKIKELMERSGLNYTEDPIDQMGAVLSLMQAPVRRSRKEKVQEI